ncbi:MAG: hypothetical protein KZQ95_11940 [Candidatus Thiodiazotropha sp. (ex Epidulcina cf. delphinae)]|nr:hypothetical protein [Candidatus Thiodiazotropha sp. (ex Epidulcina cf. delphinae)]
MKEKTELFVTHGQSSATGEEGASEWMRGADAVVLDPCHCSIEAFRQMPVEHAVISAGDPERDRIWLEERACQWVSNEGLEAVAKLRDRWPELDWVPKLSLYRPQTNYCFPGPANGEGFSFYTPDTASLRAWRLSNEDISLTEAMALALAMGFPCLWLHSETAEFDAKGLDLEMLDKVRGTPLDIWISGGVSDRRHLHNLVKTGGASAVVVSEKFAREAGVDLLSADLLHKGYSIYDEVH